MDAVAELWAAGERVDDAHARLAAAEAAGDLPGRMAASEDLWSAEADARDAAEKCGWLFALLLRCALDAPTVGVKGLAAALKPAVGAALAGQVEWQRRKVNELLAEVERQAEAIARLEAERHDAAGHSPEPPGRAWHGDGTERTGPGACQDRAGDSEGAGPPAARRAAG